MSRLSRRLVVAMVVSLLPLALGGQALASGAGGWQGLPSVLTAADVARLSANATNRSIIVLRNQHGEVPARAATAASRARTEASDQAPIRSELSTLHSASKSLHTVNAIEAAISSAEAQRLSANPAVMAV